jgi:hypothetical protein
LSKWTLAAVRETLYAQADWHRTARYLCARELDEMKARFATLNLHHTRGERRHEDPYRRRAQDCEMRALWVLSGISHPFAQLFTKLASYIGRNVSLLLERTDEVRGMS